MNWWALRKGNCDEILCLINRFQLQIRGRDNAFTCKSQSQLLRQFQRLTVDISDDETPSNLLTLNEFVPSTSQPAPLVVETASSDDEQVHHLPA